MQLKDMSSRFNIHTQGQRIVVSIVSDRINPVNIVKIDRYSFWYFRPPSQSYGIEIIPEDSGIYNCAFTGDLSGLDIYTKLDLICKSVGVSYEIDDVTIKISGEACVK